jgi:hypothetical protein
MQFFQDVLTHTVISTGVFEAYDLISFAGAKITAADAVVLGVAKSPNTVIGDAAPVMVSGIARVRAVGVINAGGRVVSAAAGGVQAQGAGVNPFAVALSTAADGEFVTILIR